MRRAALIAAVLAVAASPAMAADLPGPQIVEADAGRFEFAFSSYLWAAGLSGRTSVGRLPAVDINFSFNDILSNLDFTTFNAGEARFERFVAFADFQYTKITVDQSVPGGVLATRTKLRSETLSLLMTAGYQVVDDDRWRLQALGGARVHNVSNRISVFGGALGDQGRELSETWVDPVVGLKGAVQVTPAVNLLAWGFVGGFGVSSDINWDVLGAVRWAPTERFSAVLGYRASGVDYDSAGFEYDTITQGPVLGAVFEF